MRLYQNLPHHLNCVPILLRKRTVFQLKSYYSLFIYVHGKREQKKSSPVIKFTALPVRHYYLRVAIISNVHNVRLQRRHRSTNDASNSIRRWRGSQQTGPVHTTRRSDARAARRLPWLCCGIHAACPVLYIFFRFRQSKNYCNRLRFDWVAVKCTLLRFVNHGKNVGIIFSR